jgi:hypothetical protein
MTTATQTTDAQTDDRCIRHSRKVHFDVVDDDVIRGRELDHQQKFLPDGLTLIEQFPFLTRRQRVLLSQIHGRTYANMFRLVERFIEGKVLAIRGEHWPGDQTALEPLVRFSNEELRHKELFGRIEKMMARGTPAGYAFDHDPNRLAQAVPGKSTWAVRALTCHIELVTQVHYHESIRPDAELSAILKDVFLYRWSELSQHVVPDEIEWRREDARLAADERDAAVDDLIALVEAMDEILQVQAIADAAYFVQACGGVRVGLPQRGVEAGLLMAYRWQYIVSGIENPRFARVLLDLVTPAQLERIQAALISIVH